MAKDRNKYMLDGEFCVDFVIRYENLAEGMRDLCARTDMPFDPSRLPSWGGHKRGPVPQHYSEYYDQASQALVAEAYAPEIERFGYRFGAHQ